MKIQILTFVLFCSITGLFGQFDKNREIVFTSLEKALAEDPARVYILDLKQQELTSCPRVIMEFTNLEELNLAHNNIKDLDGIDFSRMRKLEEVVLYDNELTEIPYEALASIANLRMVDLGENKIESLGNAINKLRFLEKIDLSGNRISATAEDIKLPYLKTLTMERNYLNVFPDFIYQSRKLQSLNLFGNSISEISIQVNQFSKLEYFNIGDNPILTIDTNISLRKLKILILDWVDISQKSLKIDFIQASNFVETLSMEHCNLSLIPKQVFSLRRLKELSLLNNNIEFIPDDLLKNKRLRKIWIGGNLIEDTALQNLKEQLKNTEVIY